MNERKLRPGVQVVIGLTLLAFLWGLVFCIGIALYELMFRLAQALEWLM